MEVGFSFKSSRIFVSVYSFYQFILSTLGTQEKYSENQEIIQIQKHKILTYILL